MSEVETLVTRVKFKIKNTGIIDKRGFRCTCARRRESVHTVLVIEVRGYPRVFHFPRVYIQPRYFDLIFRNVNSNNMKQVVLHSVRPPF